MMIEWLYGLQHFGIKLGLDNIRALLRVLRHPERSFHTIHVAGTNGKGSVAAMADSILAAAGVPCGLFTSPHLVRPNERIRIAGRDISDAELNARLEAMRDTIEAALVGGDLEVHPSFFEVITATALEAFRDHRLDAAVLEVGLGGRLDATNAVDAGIGVVVSIGLDHTKTLGGTIEAISREKAGIIKRGMTVISGVTQQIAIDVVRDTCRQRGATFVDARTDVGLEARNGDRFSLVGYPDLECALTGGHQIDNARIAVSAVKRWMESAGRKLEPEHVREGLLGVRWPGRLQTIDRGPERPRMLLDGAHNPAGMATLVEHLQRHGPGSSVALFGMTSGKPVEQLLGPLAGRLDAVVLTRPPVTRGVDPAEILEETRRIVPSARVIEAIADPAEALERADVLASNADRELLVTGSIYLIGAILGVLESAPVPGPVSM